MYPENCVSCSLYQTCKTYRVRQEYSKPLNPRAAVDLLVVGEAPGANEDEQGRPFVGRSGEFLRQYLDCWEGTYAITNAVKCRPPENRTPSPQEVAYCEPFLTEDISLANPRVILLLGGTALKAVWKDGPSTIAKARVSPVKLGNTWIVVTYHPSMHISGRQDLTQEYVRAFELASKCVSGEFVEENPDIREVASAQDLQAMVRQIASSPRVYLDIETDTHPKVESKMTTWMPRAKLICLGIGTSPKEPVWVVPQRLVTRRLVQLLYGKTVVAHNCKFDINALAWWYDRDLWNHIEVEDTMLMHSSLDQGRAGNGLKEMVVKYLGVPDWSREVWDLVAQEDERRKKKREPMTATLKDIPFQSVVAYNGRDVYYTMRVHDYLLKNMPPPEIYSRLLMPATKVCATLELRGLGASRKMHQALLNGYQRKIGEIQTALRSTAEVRRVETLTSKVKVDVDPLDGHAVINVTPNGKIVEFNSNSPIHLTKLLEVTDIEVTQKTATGRPVLDKATIGELAKLDPIWNLVHHQRQHRNIISKFLVPYTQHIATDGRIHGRYNLCKVDVSGYSTGADASGGGVDSGRLSVQDPALHNIKNDPILQMMFQPRPGRKMLTMDLEQAEVRVYAYVSGCKAMLAACEEGNIYTNLARIIWNIQAEEAAKGTPLYKRAKQIVLAKQYLMGVETFARSTGIMLHEAQAIYDLWDKRFHEMNDYAAEIIALARSGKPVPTISGRSCTYEYLEERDRGDQVRNEHTDRKAVNATVQGPTSDYVLEQAVLAEDYWQQNDLHIELVLLVHDAHDMEVVDDDCVHEYIAQHKAILENTANVSWKLDVPLPVEVKWGDDMGHLEPWKPEPKGNVFTLTGASGVPPWL